MSVAAAVPVRLFLFGPFEGRVHGQPLPRLRFRKSQAVLALLALRAGGESEREWLAGLLWPDGAAAAGLHSLRNCLTDLRAALGAEAGRLRSPTSRTLTLDLTGAWVDVLAFDAALARGNSEALAEAVALYRGPLLEGWEDAWAFQQRQAREQGYLGALEKLAALAQEQGELAEAERCLRRAVATDPLRESAQRSLMAVLAAGGNYTAVLTTYRELRQRLHREAHSAPDPETQALFHWLRDEARVRTPARVSPRPVETTMAAAASPDSGSSGEASSAPAADDHRRAAIRHCLPLSLTSFIGRQDEIAEIQHLLGRAVSHPPSAVGDDRPAFTDGRWPTADGARLVTLTGAGGCGKSRLALEVARGLGSSYPDGVWFVGLASLTDAALVPETVAAVLGVREQPGGALVATLIETLHEQQLLLLLDNCEHLVAACATLAEALLQACPYLAILTTSREPLGCEGEWPYGVPSLSLPPLVESRESGVESSEDNPPAGLSTLTPASGCPPTPRAPELSTLLQYEAIRLFAERAAAVQPAFAVTAANAATVARVCRRLDGIPLAIELAASRLQALPLETLHLRLDDMFGLLTGGRRTALPQHRTLRATIDWSYALLTPEEQALLRQLSVFAGGCTLEAAEAVCGFAGVRGQGPGVSPTQTQLSELAPDPWPLAPSVLDLLTRLVEKSLVVYEERAGEGHYRLLEMVREYAREKLTASGERDGFGERHARFFLALAETAERELSQAESGQWPERLERELDNVRSALTWCGEAGVRGEGSGVSSDNGTGKDERVSGLAELTPDPSPLTPLEIGLRLGSALQEFWISRGHAQEGRTHLHRLLVQPEAAAPGPATPSFAGYPGGAPARARALSTAGVLTQFGGELEAARALYEESLAIWRHLENPAGIATALYHLGRLAVDQWDWTTARTRVQESLVLWRALSEPAGTANALSLLAEVCRQEGDAAAARALIEENVAIWRQLGDRSRLMAELDALARAAMQQGDFEAARGAIEESLAVARELGHKPGIAGALTALGHVAHWQEEYLAARAFFQESLLLWRELDHQQAIVDTLGHLSLTFIGVGESAVAYQIFEEVLPLARSLAPLYVARGLASMGGCAADLGRWEEATARCLESLRMGSSYEYEDPIHIAWDLTVLSGVALAQGRPARAARLLGAAELLWAGSTHRRHPLVHRRLEGAAAAVRAQLGAAEYEAAWSEGQATPLEQTIAAVLEEAG